MSTQEQRRAPLVFALTLLALAAPARAVEIDFEDVGANLPIDGNLYYNGADGAGGFVSRGARFSNTFTDFGGGFTGWDGWAYSQMTDTTTPGFGNQYSAFPGGGAGDSATYGVGSPGSSSEGDITTITFASERTLDGAYFANTTYAALAMLNGDAFAKQFGGASGDDPDWLRLSVAGYDAAGALTGNVEIYLADYRFADNALDYVLDEWLWLDLAGLGRVESLDFVLSGSDVGAFGLNTPAYFALDGLRAVPEPGSAALLAVGLVGLAARVGRRRRHRAERAARPPATSRDSLGTLLIATALALCVPGAARAQGGYAAELMQTWASDVDAFERGPMDIADPGAGTADYGIPENTLGPASGDSADVFSLGDGGSITLFFASGIGDGPGDDFAVYENGFYSVEGLFAEFAFVEVSSNGVDFARFDSLTFQTTPVPSFGAVDPMDYENFAGDQPLAFGTGFDLAELVGHPLVASGLLDLTDVAYVRLIDVIGDGSALDAAGQPVYDPYPTPFAVGGFDAEAVGVLHVAPEPSSSVLLAAGAGLLALLARWRTRARGRRLALCGCV